MIDKYIHAYREAFFDWDSCSSKEFYKKNKKILCIMSGVILVFLLLTVLCLKSDLLVIKIFPVFLEIVVTYMFNRYAVKEYRKYIMKRQEHLGEVIFFLRTLMVGDSLLSADKIDLIVQRLEERIETENIYEKIKEAIVGFSQICILPVITYIAGAYSSSLEKVDFEVVVSWGMVIVFCGAIVALMLYSCDMVLRMIACKNTDAAIAFREDLLDIRLLYFDENKQFVENKKQECITQKN